MPFSKRYCIQNCNQRKKKLNRSNSRLKMLCLFSVSFLHIFRVKIKGHFLFPFPAFSVECNSRVNEKQTSKLSDKNLETLNMPESDSKKNLLIFCPKLKAEKVNSHLKYACNSMINNICKCISDRSFEVYKAIPPGEEPNSTLFKRN